MNSKGQSGTKFCSYWAAYSIPVWQSARKMWRYQFKPTKEVLVYRLTSSPDYYTYLFTCEAISAALSAVVLSLTVYRMLYICIFSCVFVNQRCFVNQWCFDFDL